MDLEGYNVTHVVQLIKHYKCQNVILRFTNAMFSAVGFSRVKIERDIVTYAICLIKYIFRNDILWFNEKKIAGERVNKNKM